MRIAGFYKIRIPNPDQPGLKAWHYVPLKALFISGCLLL